MTRTAYEFQPAPEAPAEARAVALHWVRRDAGVAVAEPAVLELVVSELVTNAVRHGEGPVTLQLVAVDGEVAIGVHDHGSELPELPRRAVQASSPRGRGLQIIDRVARRWRVRPDERGGKTVWVSLPATHEQATG